MCPPAQSPPSEIDLYWSDERIISFLAEYTQGSHLPANVLADSSPYQFPPFNLPEGIWYLVHSNEKKESASGFWKAKGEACKVYSNATISGWRTTLEYFEGMAPHGQLTDWLMQEYWITQKELSDKDKGKESRLLCRVFLCNGYSSKSEINPQNCKTIIESQNINPVVSINPNTNITSEQDSGSESKAKREYEVGAFPVVADQIPDFSPQDCFLKGDFLELNDLEDRESHSSSSQNSSCPSKSSDEYFDSSAFLRDIVEEANKLRQEQRSSSRYNFSSSQLQNGVVLQPAFSGAVLSGSVISDVIEASQTSSTTNDSLSNTRVQEQTTKRQNPDDSTAESTSNFCSVGAPSTSHKNTVPSGEKKSGASRMKKLKFYLCFASF